VKGKAYCFEHFVLEGLKPKEVAVEGFVQSLDITKDLNDTYTQLNLHIMCKGNVAYPIEVGKCKIVFYYEDEDKGNHPLQHVPISALKKIMKRGKKKEKKEPSEYRMIRL
jgi:hypothetical protein